MFQRLIFCLSQGCPASTVLVSHNNSMNRSFHLLTNETSIAKFSKLNTSVSANCKTLTVFRNLRTNSGIKKLSSENERNIPNECRVSEISERSKILKVAIIGVPNSGKSTLINQIVGRNVFAASKKVHTTRVNARAIMVTGETQVVFLDTPGIVSVAEGKKHKLEPACINDSGNAIEEADVVGVIHDASNKHTLKNLDPKVLRLLMQHPLKHHFLILNKIDVMKTKRHLLDCAKNLTSGCGKFDNDYLRDNIEIIFNVNKEGRSRISETEIQTMVENQTGWPLFKDVFMISALSGDGVGDLQFYLTNLAKPGPWLFDEKTITDQSDIDLVQKTVFAKLLDNLPNVVPYNLKTEIEYFNVKDDGSVTTVILIKVKHLRIKKLIVGSGGRRIRNIATDIEQFLRRYFLNDVHVKLVLLVEEPKQNDNLRTEIRSFLDNPNAILSYNE